MGFRVGDESPKFVYMGEPTTWLEIPMAVTTFGGKGKVSEKGLTNSPATVAALVRSAKENPAAGRCATPIQPIKLDLSAAGGATPILSEKKDPAASNRARVEGPPVIEQLEIVDLWCSGQRERIGRQKLNGCRSC
ncbi:unnamed protein product [Citrullus colocynthis]|uniref:Uncharacterized protein n=1 Tax=Citrullus colocynthis TaxID=252529 RepID=A0ABP0XMK5_9ROSI